MEIKSQSDKSSKKEINVNANYFLKIISFVLCLWYLELIKIKILTRNNYYKHKYKHMIDTSGE